MKYSKSLFEKKLPHELRIEARRAARMQRLKAWSPMRPAKVRELLLFEKLMLLAKEKFRGMTVHQIADATGLSPTTISKHMGREIKAPQGASLQMWLNALNISIDI